MSEEIDLDANNLSIPEDVFEKFQSSTPLEEDEYITLSDILPPRPNVPDLSHELNEIPFDNEVVLGSPSPQDNEGQVNRQYTGGRFLDISDNTVFTESRLDTCQDAYHNNGLSRDFDISDSRPKRQKVMEYFNERPDLSSDGLGAQNYVIEDSSSIIQDSLLSTNVGQSDTLHETPSDIVEESDQPRRTKRGRIPNTARYPMTSASNSSNSDTSKATPGRRRPGRPKKVPPVHTTSEPDSTNIDNNCSLLPENESATEVSGCDELTPNNSVKKDRRSRRITSLNEDQPAPTPSKRGRKPKPKPLAEQSNCHINENVLNEFTKDDVCDGSVPRVDVSSATLSTSKRKKPSAKKGYKSGVTKQLENVVQSGKNIDLDDDADDIICLSKLKQDLNPNEAESQSTGEPKQLTDLPFNTEGKPNDDIHIDSETKLVDGANNNMALAVLTDDIHNDVNSVEAGGSSHKRNSKMPVMSDFEYNVDKIVKEASIDGQTTIAADNECLLVEDTSKRRRTAKKTFVYDEGSDEDPFANMESSDDEPKRKKKGTKYYSDDEYVPDGSNKKRGKIRSSSSESDINDEEDNEFVKLKNKNMGLSPFKKGRKPLSNKSLVSTIKPQTEDDDIEVCLETTMIKVDESLKPPAEAWATSNEFENFIAQKTQGTNLKIKKVSMKEITDTLAPLDIPVVQQNEPKKTTEISTQTNKASTYSTSVQTSAPYDIPMKTNISLTPTQSEKACEFLSSVVKTTVELGQLMSEKSDDFMKKKINPGHVTDTFKMDYCVRKSFLLFKLAKHNLLQMEEDLANQYESFLKEQNLSSCREVPKKITPKPKADSDSDCEIVEVVGSASSSTKKPERPKFNHKTVFLNKELSIKIAKKPSAPEKPVPGKKKLEMKGRHAVWINKNVMVKKITPTQSFLAQDSRNKKPPDTYITEKMVSDFFEDYNRRKAIFMCAPFLNTDWTRVQREIACHYFVSDLDAANTSRNTNDLNPSPTEINPSPSIETSDENCDIHEISNIKNPKSLFSLCVEAIPICFHVKNNKSQATPKLTCNVTDGTDTKKPLALFRLCVIALRGNHFDLYKKQESEDRDDINNLLDFPDPNNSESTEDNKFEDMNDWSDLRTTEYDIRENGVDDESNVLCVTEDVPIQSAVSPLSSICYKNIVKLFTHTNEAYNNFFPGFISVKNVNNIESIDGYYNTDDDLEKKMLISPSNEDLQGDDNSQQGNEVKSLITLCVELVQGLQRWPRVSPILSIMSQPSISGIKSLKSIAFENVKCILYPSCDEAVAESDIESETNIENEPMENFTINCINTLSEEAFQSLQIPSQIRIRKQSQDSSNFSDRYDNDGCGENDEMDSNPNHEVDDNGWASQLQVQEFRSCFTPHVDTTENMTEENRDTLEAQEPHVATPQIKSEPIDYFPEEVVDTSIIKTEPLQTLHALTGMAHIPDGIIAKKEIPEVVNDRGGSPTVQSISGFNMETFEQFVRSNKMITSMDPTNDEIFSQSGLRIRRQHEPDVDQDNDTSMSLLVPHTFEPLQLVEAKNRLLETSSDDDDSNHKKYTGKKKEKKKKKSKKDTKTVNNKETPPVAKEKIVPETELALLTRKMKEKIRQEEKKIESSDSDSENLYLLSSKKDKNKKDLENKKIQSSGSESDTLYKFSSSKDEKVKNSKKENEKTKEVKSKTSKEKNDLVQCNNVDSTEKSDDSKKFKNKELNNFSGFTAIDQNEMTNYQKLMQFVYDKIIPSEHEDIVNIPENHTPEVSNDTSPVIHPDEPVELLECEPTMPIFDTIEPNKRSTPKKAKNKKNLEVVNEVLKEKQQFIERHGWHCYPIDSNDAKIYSEAQINLEKLPESFVETYMEYQDVMDKDLDDQEVDRLINLQSLNRSISIKDGKLKSRLKGTNKEVNSGNISRSISPTYSDNFDELAPSEDEGPSVEDETPPPMPVRSSENNLAKNLLMEDNNSDSDGADGKKKIKQEPKELEEIVEKPYRPGPKSKTKDKIDSDSLMLTADKMMNKELTLLHAPIVLPDDVTGIPAHKETSHKEEAKSSKRSSRKRSRYRVRNDDDSSSEEEKQWVSTKEKLLKRLGKKEDAVVDDAKRAKLVNEFIERRNESDRKNVRQSGQGRKGRARRKMLERQKQLRFLSNELYNEGDGLTTGKRGAAAGLFKGRRNIRKVIDKKSLARSTVIANMEEFERKRRLNMRQNKLRDVLGFEEGVNVLVINDEVCLEYDFEEQRPVVTVHQFFTKVMKAHQYEGVKFMWDACFESLDRIERGHGGGGCILAHCMGLGKTLQVLALLHTVLTHPRTNMHRVLVCCPLSTVLNWVDEIHKWIGPVTHEIKVFELSKLKKTYERAYQLEDWYSGGGIFIIGYELFRSLTTLDSEIDEIRPTIINKIRTALLDPGPDIIICDEGHLLKNDCSVLAVAMSRVVTKRRIVLTGTPMQNNLREYFCMVNFIKPNLLGTYSEYSNRFENPIMNGQHRDSVEEDIKLMKARTHILHKVLEGCLQRQEASVLYPYLPKKHEYTVFIPLTQCQWDLYNHYMSNYAKTNKQSVLRDFHTLQKIWSHPQVLHSFQMKSRDKKDKIKAEKIEDDLAIADQEADIKPAETEVWWLQYLGEGAMLDSLDSSNKFVAVFRILHECVALGDKVLIFSTSLFCLDALEYFLKKINNWSLGQEYYRLDGSVPAEVRQKWVREFNADNNIKTKLFLISTRAGCLGLNMTAANRVIILDTSWNPAHDIQSIFRVYRFGQKKDCYIYRLVAMGTMEQKIYERSVTKQAVACRVVDEQQIDRHYNLAELTELYSIDEMGLSVAGGVAVGVGDVALLRVARDAAIHAVHEHDSLLRGSGEQGLPEHERAAAWNQFQQEHENKQMQNDLNANRAVVALKRLEMEHLRQQALYSPTLAPAPPFTVKSEPTPDYPLLVPHDAQPGKYRGRKHKSTNVIQCRIPIAIGPQPGPSITTEYDNEVLVQKITELLVKHNFKQNQPGPKKISDLVAKVKRMVTTGKLITLGPGYDELSSSIANVLLHREVPMPPLTNIERPMESILNGKQKTKDVEETQISQVVEEAPVPPVVEDIQETDGRRRRKAAMAAEKQIQAEHNIIDLDNDDNDWQNDDMDNEPVVEPEPQEPVAKEKGTKAKEVEFSILLSDDDVTPEPEVIPPAAPVETNNVDSEVVPLHPSLLTNANFIKIVAHTYLAGNPMMDEDAATLAAQYSTLKTLKEAESEGKPIVNGPVYDIAIKVLGKDVLKKLQIVNPKTIESQNSLCATTTKLKSLLTETKPGSTPAPVHKKPKIGPKSKVMKEVKQEQDSLPMEPARSTKHTGATTNTVRVSKSVFGPSTCTPHEESILPDEEVIITLPQGNQPDTKPIILRKVKLERKPAVAIRLPGVPLALSRDQPEATICLDSDEEDAAPAPTRPQRMIVQLPTMVPSLQPAPAPVPVALSGPRHVTLPFPPPPPPTTHPPHPPPPAFYTLSPCGTRAIPISMAGSSGSLPVPMSLAGPGIYSVAGREPVPTSQRMPVPVGLSGPVPMSLVDASGRPVSISAASMRSQSGPLTLRIETQPSPSSSTPAGPGFSLLRPQPSATAPSKPSDRLQDTRASLLDILKRNKANSKSVVHSIPDDPPTPPLKPAAAPPRKRPSPPAPPRRRPSPPAPPRRRPSPPAPPRRRPSPPAPPRRRPSPPAPPRRRPSPPAPPRRRQSPAAPPRRRPSPAAPSRRRSSSSSSSSSARSRSSSPDPLSILKDVVHIQAPSKPPSASSSKPMAPKPTPKPAPKPTPPPRKTSSVHGVQASIAPSVKPTPKPPGGRSISSSVDLNQIFFGPSRSNLGAKIRGSVDLTSAPAAAKSSPKSAPSSSKDAGFHRLDSRKVSGSFTIEASIPHKGNKPMAKPNGPSKLVGTSKSIILDGRSKSLKVENKGSGIQVTSSKVQSNSISKQKIPDKRPAPSTSAPASKKKKTDQMTLKDFDIDDIDDIIELD